MVCKKSFRRNSIFSRGTYVPPTTPSMLRALFFGARVSTKKRTMILRLAKYHCKNGCRARAELGNTIQPRRAAGGVLGEPAGFPYK